MTSATGVTFSDLGTRGRLGNQLWQIAAVIGLSIDHGLSIRLPPWRFGPAFNTPASWFTPPGPGDAEAYDLVDYLLPADRYVLQDLRLWWRHQDVVRERLKPTSAVLQAAQDLYISRPTAVHIRRGDYLTYPSTYPLPSIDYYRTATAGIPARDITVFTDDPAWVVANLPFFAGAQMTRGPANFIDLAAMSQCERHVIANSSFSWWGAFLSASSDVVYPSRWYTDEWAPQVSSWITPPHWKPVN